MRYLTYTLVGVGGLIAIAALAVVFLADEEPVIVEPQSDIKGEMTVGKDLLNDKMNKAEKTTDQNSHTSQTSQAGMNDEPAAAGKIDQGKVQDLPAIDLAQVKPDGQAVFAGQATPGAIITVFEGEILLGETVADDNGEWVVILEKTLAPGQHLVSVAMETMMGEVKLAETTLAIEIVENRDEKPLVAVLPQTENEMPKLLQSPDDRPLEPTSVGMANGGSNNAPNKGGGDSTEPTIAPRALVWRDNSELEISGVASGGVRVTATTGSGDFAEALVMENGKWSLFGTIDPLASWMEFSFSIHDETGASIANYILPVTVRDLDVGLDGSEMVVINKGDALWRVAYRSYGEGVRYVDIVRRNAGAIADPNLIYPNQIFALPKQ